MSPETARALLVLMQAADWGTVVLPRLKALLAQAEGDWRDISLDEIEALAQQSEQAEQDWRDA